MSLRSEPNPAAISPPYPHGRADPAGASPAERLAAQIAHRAGSVALFLALGGVGAMLAGGRHPTVVAAHRPLLMLAFVCADLGLLGAFAALALARRAGRGHREALGALLFNLTLLLAALGALAFSWVARRPG